MREALNCNVRMCESSSVIQWSFVFRNSSPSISMFSGARDRVSPQAVQDLMELCRLGGTSGTLEMQVMLQSAAPRCYRWWATCDQSGKRQKQSISVSTY